VGGGGGRRKARAVKVHLVYLTYNRLDYTKLSLPRLLADPTEEFDVTIWDNGSTDGTQEYLTSVKDPRIVELKLSRENVGQVAALNEVWSRLKADLLGKCDNDCLVTPGWTETLAKAHEDIPNLGVVACWHFFPDDFDYQRARKKIQRFGTHQIFRHPTTCGTGLLVKRSVYKRLGPLDADSTTGYWMRMALAGYVNGWYYPLVYQEHMDDPKSAYTMLKDDRSYQAAKAVTFNINSPGQETLAGRWKWRDEVLRTLHDSPVAPRYYLPGWQGKLRRGLAALRGFLGSS
jgi:glycosyltransferase involved in cell wall biosynthesis